jgi:hypothetical protein
MATQPPSVGLADLPYRAPYTVNPVRGRPADSPAPALPLHTHRVEIVARSPEGALCDGPARCPAHPIFEAAFSAFGRGTLIATPEGEIAIEDLLPGDLVITGSGAPAEIRWIGSCNFPPEGETPRPKLIRVFAGTFGLSRPHSFVTFGQGARILQTPLPLRAEMGPRALLTQIGAFLDGEAVIEIDPPTPVRLYHLMLDRHATIRASGLECETFHPSRPVLRSLPRSLRQSFLEMFPHLGDAAEFGPLAHPRAPDMDEDGGLY